jgi:signal transduction histidine kinase
LLFFMRAQRIDRLCCVRGMFRAARREAGEAQRRSPYVREPESPHLRIDRVATLAQPSDAEHYLASLLAHEVRNVLTPVRAFAQIAAASPGDVALTLRALESVVMATDYLQPVLEALLAPSRAAVQQRGLQGAASDPIDAAVALARIAYPSVPVHLERGDDAPPLPTHHHAIVSHILLNLILNAQRAAADVPRPRVQVAATSADHGAVIIDVTDNGRGIPPDARKRLEGEGSVPRGTGLGLAVVRALLPHVDGRVRVVQADGSGTTVRLELRAAAARQAA